MQNNGLGQNTVYPQAYNARLLNAVPRSDNRSRLELDDALPFTGVDIWHAYEISWLNAQGKPQACIGRFSFDCRNPYLIESKSLKLYLNSHNQTVYENRQRLQQVLRHDLSAKAGGTVAVELFELGGSPFPVTEPHGICLDELELTVSQYQPDKALLGNSSAGQLSECCYTNLFRSNCPITNQPDWASVSIDYYGPAIDHRGLLAYLVSYRLHNDYHENCVEQIFMDILRQCGPQRLKVQANFLRRGGLDINPVRSTKPADTETFPRYVRQ